MVTPPPKKLFHTFTCDTGLTGPVIAFNLPDVCFRGFYLPGSTWLLSLLVGIAFLTLVVFDNNSLVPYLNCDIMVVASCKYLV